MLTCCVNYINTQRGESEGGGVEGKIFDRREKIYNPQNHAANIQT